MDWDQIKIRKPGLIGPTRWNWLVDQIKSAFIQSVTGGTWQRGPGGTSLWLDGSFSGDTSASPFAVSIRQKEGGGYEAKVEANSWLLNSLRPGDTVEITGLGVWFDLIGNDNIWLGVLFDEDGDPTSASIDSWGQGDDFDIEADAWSNSNSYCEDNGDSENPKHQASRIIIGYTIADDDGAPILTQCCMNNLILRRVCIDDRPARFAFPSPYRPYTP